MEPHGFVRLGFLSGLPQAGRKVGLVLAHHPQTEHPAIFRSRGVFFSRSYLRQGAAIRGG